MSARIFTIPSRTPFVDALAAGILERYGATPDALGAVTVLLPTRRACRALGEAFLRVAGGTLLLPTMRPLGDVEEDALAMAAFGSHWEGDAAQVLELPPALSPLRRQVLLAQLILHKEFHQGREAPGPDQALFLAAELGRLLDLMQTEGVEFKALESVVPETLASHWQETLDFLQLVTKHWPEVLAEEGALDPADRRNRLMRAQAEHWRANPPSDPVIAAGSTGTVPATADLMAVIAGLPQGAVVLPGLDVAMPANAWEAIDPGHPQAAMKQLLGRLGVDLGDVREWGADVASAAPIDRTALLAEALRPAAAWLAPEESPGADPQILAGFHQMECAGPEQEARAIALVLREALETPARTAALVTPDRDLARRVAVELTRWGLKIDDSAGVPLGQTPVGSFLRLTAEMLAEHVAPVPLLAVCKHPLAAAGLAPAAFRNQARRLEEQVLRGPRPAPGFEGLIAAAKAEAANDLVDWLAPIAQASREISDEMKQDKADLGALVRAHLRFVEFLAADNAQTGDQRLWAKDDGEAAALWIAEVLAAAPSAPAFKGDHYPMVLEALMSGVVVRPTYGRHPRLHIWGTLEARLQHADVLVLGGLNEGTWPGEPKADPWLSRPMRAQAGLPMPEQRIGLSAHDFAQAASAPVAVLTRATKVAGQPTVPSRWLERLRAVLAGRSLAFAPSPWLGWQGELDRPAAVKSLGPPQPTPPVSARPRKLSATRIETWVRDPYGIYAQYVLGLRALDPLDADPGAAERGIIIHQALDEFVRQFPKELPSDGLERLIGMGKQAFGETLERPGVWAFWWPRFERIAQWFVAHETQRRLEATVVGSEVRGQLEIPAPGGSFIVSAIADRIERLADGNLVIVDYKTGSAPQNQDLKQGFSPQLPIEAVLAEAGGFGGVAGGPVSQLAVWRVSGAGDGGDVQAYKKLDVPETVEQTRAGLARLIAAFDDPNMPYRSRPRPDHQPRFSDYDHLARVKEWSAGGGGE